MKKRVLFPLLAGVSLFLFSFSDTFFDISRSFETYSAVLKNISQYYVEDTDPGNLTRMYLEGMLKTLDPFTNYFSGAQIERARIQQEGKFGGIGIQFALRDKYPFITEIEKNQPADKAGLKTGDVIYKIDGSDVLDKNMDEINQALVGQPGSAISLSIWRKENDKTPASLEFQLKREEIQETNVPFFGMVEPEIGCIRLKIFNPDAGKDVRNAFDSLKRANPELKGIILDLRGNPGGLLQEAVRIVNIWVEEGVTVVTTKGKMPEWNKVFRTTEKAADTRIPIVALVNAQSASASEIVSASLQDLDRGVVLGQKSYGKGLVQITRNLPYNTMLKVTCAKYYTYSGRCVQALNYAEKNPDGSIRRVPDSLRAVFVTKGGRKVLDGGGVDPDVAVAAQKNSPLRKAIEAKFIIADFASRYIHQHPLVENPAVFQLSDEDYEAFVQFVRSQNLEVPTETGQWLKKLEESAEDEMYLESLRPSIESVKRKINRDIGNMLQEERSVLQPLVENEIVGRQYYAYGKILKGYQNDTEIKEAVRLLRNTERYNQLLSAKK